MRAALLILGILSFSVEASAKDTRQCLIDSIGVYCQSLVNGAINGSESRNNAVRHNLIKKHRPSNNQKIIDAQKRNKEELEKLIFAHDDLLKTVKRKIDGKMGSDTKQSTAINPDLRVKLEKNAKLIVMDFDRFAVEHKYGDSESHELFKTFPLCTLQGKKKELQSFVRKFQSDCR